MARASEAEVEETGKRRRPSLSGLILTALFAGIAAGLFFGESAAILQGVADGFIRLLQMAVLPYLVVSLIAGLGALSYRQAGELARKGGLLLLLLWGLVLTVVFLTPLAFPERASGSFFSTALVQPATQFDFIGLYIPQNPFRSLSDSAVPAVVLFCLALGVALIGVEGSDRLVANLAILGKALSRISGFVLYLTPIGVFAIAASAAGTMTLAEFDQLQVYVIPYVLGALLVGLWILPGVVTALSPLTYRQVIRETRDAMVTAFTTGSLFVVLPLISESAKRLLEAHPHENDDSMVDVMVPVSFNFPHAGNLFALVFILFAAWFAGEPVGFGDYPTLAFTGVASLFAATTAAVPFLLDLFRIPTDMSQLFFATGVVNRRFATLVAAMHVFSLTLLVTLAVSGGLRAKPRRLLRYAVTTLVLLALFVFGTQTLLARTVTIDYSQARRLSASSLSMQPVPFRILEAVPAPPALPPPPGGSRLDRIEQSGVLRVGYGIGHISVPFTFENDAGKLVGLDIDMAHRLARDLGVEIDFVPFALDSVTEMLNDGRIDIAMSNFVIGADISERLAFSSPYMEVSVSFLVLDHERGRFARWEDVRRRDDLRIGVEPASGHYYYIEKMQELLPNAEVVQITTEEFLEGDSGVDGLIHAAEVNASLALLHPDFAVVVPKPVPFKAPVAYGLPTGDQEMINLVSEWIELKRLDGTLDDLYAYWVLGRDRADQREPRWSVIRDVLGWVE